MESSLINGSSPFKSAKYTFCVPDEWYRRPGSRAASMAPSESTLRRLSELENDEGEGTAKLSNMKAPSTPTSPSPIDTKKLPSPDSYGTFSTRRFSSMFEGWIGSSTNPLDSEEDFERKRPIVSEPVTLEKGSSNNISDSDGEQSVDEDDFEHMIVS